MVPAAVELSWRYLDPFDDATRLEAFTCPITTLNVKKKVVKKTTKVTNSCLLLFWCESL